MCTHHLHKRKPLLHYRSYTGIPNVTRYEEDLAVTRTAIGALVIQSFAHGGQLNMAEVLPLVTQDTSLVQNL